MPGKVFIVFNSSEMFCFDPLPMTSLAAVVHKWALEVKREREMKKIFRSNEFFYLFPMVCFLIFHYRLEWSAMTTCIVI